MINQDVLSTGLLNVHVENELQEDMSRAFIWLFQSRGKNLVVLVSAKEIEHLCHPSHAEFEMVQSGKVLQYTAQDSTSEYVMSIRPFMVRFLEQDAKLGMSSMISDGQGSFRFEETTVRWFESEDKDRSGNIEDEKDRYLMDVRDALAVLNEWVPDGLCVVEEDSTEKDV
jgi:hypothetical protein